jgi:hypothetical protein
MAIFKTTKQILETPWEDELLGNRALEDTGGKIWLPPGGPDDLKNKWDYSRELSIDDIDIWEQIYYQGGGLGLYAAWKPYAEFYLITHHLFRYIPNSIETFYGPNSGIKARDRAIELGMPIFTGTSWVKDDEMWLYSEPETKKLFFN